MLYSRRRTWCADRRRDCAETGSSIGGGGTLGLSNWLLKGTSVTLDGTQRIPKYSKVLTGPSVEDQRSGYTYLLEVGQATESTYPAVVMTQIGFSSVHQLLFGQFWTIFWLISAKQVKWLHRSNFLLKQEKNYLSANSNLNPIAPCDINGSSGAKP